MTNAQYELLRSIEHMQMPVAAHYEPAKKLVAKGFAEWRSGPYLDLLEITPTGRALLTDTQQGAET